MSNILTYIVVYPLLFILSLIDSCLNCCKKRDIRFKQLPLKPPYSTKIQCSEPNQIAYRSCMSNGNLFKITNQNTNLYNEFVEWSKQFKNKQTMGVREILSIEDQTQPDGKVFKKFNLKNDYTWLTYETMLKQIDMFANGLLKLGLKSNENIVIFSETRPEWIMSALSCFKIKVTIVTLYATLGTEALAYGINQTDAKFLIASGESVLKVKKIIDQVSNLKCVIVLDELVTRENVEKFRHEVNNCLIYNYKEVMEIGRTSEKLNHEHPTKNDLAIIMYTSGSTGNPKGVMMSHENLLTALKKVVIRIGTPKDTDTYIAYLPLAHVFELMCELAFLSIGLRIGYSSAQTLSDASTAIKEGQIGDLRVLKPDVIACVPTVLERLSKGVKDKINKEKDLKKNLIAKAAEKKLKKIRAGKCTTMLDKVVFSKLNQALFGGNLKCIISGGALLNKDLQEFAQVYFASCIQAYGLTETCAGSTTQFGFEYETQTVGSVVESCEIRLVDWPEGNYRSSDKPNPRGEIWVGGDNITLGYYKMPEKTAEDYHLINGIRYFATGDIGEMLPNGNLRIIDRKKDLVKLQSGEYVSLNKVEAVIKLLPFVDNCCVIADPRQTFCVCLISPNVKKIDEFLSTSHVEVETESGDNNNIKMQRRRSVDILNEFLDLHEKDKNLKDKFNKDIFDHCKKQGLEKFETPARVRFVREQWLPDTGLVTDSLKLKRKEIEKFYSKEIQLLYS